MFDRNKDGYIDLNELKKVIRSFSLRTDQKWISDQMSELMLTVWCSPQVTSLIGTSLSAADLYKFMAEADKVIHTRLEVGLNISCFRMEMEKLTTMNLWRWWNSIKTLSSFFLLISNNLTSNEYTWAPLCLPSSLILCLHYQSVSRNLHTGLLLYNQGFTPYTLQSLSM